MAKPDFIPDGKKWNDTTQAFEDLDAKKIDDLQKLYDQARGEIVSLKSVIVDLKEKVQDAITKTTPPQQAGRMVALEKENDLLTDQVKDLTKKLEEANMKVFAKETKAKTEKKKEVKE